MFMDEVEILVESGRGGVGIVSFMREKFMPKMGPDGGNGGRGGDVVLRASSSRNTLVDYRYVKTFRAPNGESGGPTNCTGRSATHLYLEVPPGTLVWDVESGQLIADLAAVGMEVVVAPGGHGGKGNANYATATRQTPRRTGPPGPSVARRLRLELKLLADVGLIGMPNVGKSTLISRISNARPKVADYPFTTIIPNLGVVESKEQDPFVVADVPGLIPGAAEGAGLGHQFLRHIERTKVLVHLLDPVAGRDPVEDWNQIRNELGLYNPRLLDRPELVVVNKVDSLQDDELLPRLKDSLGKSPVGIITLSAATGEGIERFLRILNKMVAQERRKEALAAQDLESKEEDPV